MALPSTTQNHTILNKRQTSAVPAVPKEKEEDPSIDGGRSPFDTKLEAEGNMTTTSMESVDDLLGISFSGFNQTPSNAVPPSSLFTFSFSKFF